MSVGSADNLMSGQIIAILPCVRVNGLKSCVHSRGNSIQGFCRSRVGL